ncbi:hypothetical protein WJX82_006956 [Trebouxia sp. C0006]
MPIQQRQALNCVANQARSKGWQHIRVRAFVEDAPFPTVTDVYEEFVLAEPGQTFKVLVSVQRSTIPWPEDSTHLCVIGVLEERWFLHGKVIRRQDLAGADDEESETAVQLQQTDPTSWTSQAGLVKVVVAVGKLLQQTRSRKEHSATEPAKVICGGECKPFNLPALRVVPSVAGHHSKATPKTQNSQQAIIAGVAKITESATVMPWPAGHILIDEHDADIDEQDMLNSVALDSITVKPAMEAATEECQAEWSWANQQQLQKGNVSLDSAPLALNDCSKAACAYAQPTAALKSPNMTD